MTTKRVRKDDLSGWICEQQDDLLDLVETEHIPGSMPAGERERDAAREAFYEQLRKERT